MRVELSAYVEGLFDLRNICYFLEGDGTDMYFKIFHRIKAFQDLYPNGTMKIMPSTNRIIMEAIEWATKSVNKGGGGFDPMLVDAPPAPRARTVAEINTTVTAAVRTD